VRLTSFFDLPPFHEALYQTRSPASPCQSATSAKPPPIPLSFPEIHRAASLLMKLRLSSCRHVMFRCVTSVTYDKGSIALRHQCPWMVDPLLS
jgi:hypothetical protein